MTKTTTKILCVEDEADLRENIALILRDEGFEIIEASDGAEAYEKFNSSKPDLVLCDINMPHVNGKEFFQTLQKEVPEKLSETPFIFLTALGQKNDYISGLSLGVDEYIVKPIDFDILVSTIKSKLYKSNSQKKFSQKKINQLYDHVSHLLPLEIKEPLENIIKLSSTLKNETLGAFIDKKYADYAGKIYMSSLRLNSQISKAFDKDKISHEVENFSHAVSIEEIFNQVESALKNHNVDFNINEKSHQLRLNKQKFINILTHYIEQQIESGAQEIKVNIFLDYSKNLVVSVESITSLPVVSGQLELWIEENNSSFRVQENDGITSHLIIIPHYLVTKNAIVN